MKPLFLFFALLICLPAVAGPQLPMCIPLVNGYPASMPIVHETSRYCHAYLLCNSKDGKYGQVEGISWPKTVSACDAGSIMVKLWPILMKIHAASAKVGTAQAIYQSEVAFDCYDKQALLQSAEGQRMCLERHRLLKANKRTWFPAVDDWVRP